MNKKFQQFVPLGLILAAVLAAVVLFLISKPAIEDLTRAIEEAGKSSKEKSELEKQVRENEAAQEAKNIELRKLKPIYKTKVNSENLGIFGTMFDDIIRTAQVNGLLIRSIEYNMKPAGDLLYDADSKNYNACELKFYFVATYSQMQAFLSDMNKNFEYLTSISNLGITAFPDNPNYLLIRASITLYSQKAAGSK